MASNERTQEIMRGLYDAVVTFDEETCVKFAKAVLEEGVNPNDAIIKGLALGMEKVGSLYEKQEYFVPELLMCSDALYAALEILKPHIKVEEQATKLKVVIGTVEGDIHDIGKNLVKMMYEAAGWTVNDLGRDVKLDRFVEEIERTKADVIALSALMTTSMLAIPVVIKKIKAHNLNPTIMVGGAPLTRDIAKQYGADGYAENCGMAVQETIKALK